MGIIGLVNIDIQTWLTYILEDNLEEAKNPQIILNLFGEFLKE